MKELFVIPELRHNLLIMVVIWAYTSFNFYLLNFYIKFLPGLFVNALFSAVSEIVAYSVSGAFVKMFGLKASLVSFMSIALAGGTFLLVFKMQDQQFQDDYAILVPIFYVPAKGGLSAIFSVNYAANAQLFPEIFGSTALGLCNIFARALQVFAPMVAEVPDPVPMGILTSTSVLCLILTLFLKKPTQKFV